MDDCNPLQDRERDDVAVRAVLTRITELWADVTSGRVDADAIAAMFTDGATFVVGDGTYLRGRAEIAAYYRRMIEGEHGFSIRETTVTAKVDAVHFLSDNIAVLISRGGILFAGETVVPAERKGIQTSVLIKVNGAWLAAAYQNTRIYQYPDAS